MKFLYHLKIFAIMIFAIIAPRPTVAIVVFITVDT